MTGQFDEEGLIEDTTGLPLPDYLGLKVGSGVQSGSNIKKH